MTGTGSSRAAPSEAVASSEAALAQYERGSLAHYADPAYYDQAYADRTHDVAFYVDLALERRGPVLEYGVGSGRVAIPLARHGLRVTGIDHSAPMLARLREKVRAEHEVVASRITLRRGDMRRVRLHRQFSLVLCPFNGFLHLYTRRDVERFLARVREHLTPRGRFVFDVAMPSLTDLGRDPAHAYRTPPFRHPSAGLVRYAEHYDYDPIAQVLSVRMRFLPKRGRPFETPLAHRQFFPQELEALLYYNGLAVEKRLADFRRPLDRDADVMVLYARKR